MYDVLGTMYCAITMYHVLRIVYCVLCTMYCVLCTTYHMLTDIVCYQYVMSRHRDPVGPGGGGVYFTILCYAMLCYAPRGPAHPTATAPGRARPQGRARACATKLICFVVYYLLLLIAMYLFVCFCLRACATKYDGLVWSAQVYSIV